MSDTKKRSWAKAIVWRILGIFILLGVLILFNGSWQTIGIVTVLFHSIRMVLYYFHERVWENIKWGRK